MILQRIIWYVFGALFFFCANVSLAYADYDYQSDIQYLFDQHVADPQDFSEDAFLNKADFVKWALRNAGFTPALEADYDIPFDDVPKGSPYAPYVDKLLDTRVIFYHPLESKFFPDRPISRLQALKLLFKLEGMAAPRIFNDEWFRDAITDVDPDSHIAPFAARAIELGLLPRFVPQEFKPYYPLTHKHAARLLHNIAKFKQGTLNVLESDSNATAGPTITIVQQIGKQHEFIDNPKFDMLLNVWDKLTRTFFERGNLDKTDLVYSAIEGVVNAADDRHTQFQRPADAQALEDILGGKLEGIGVMLQQNDAGAIEVIAPLNGSPGDLAGMRALDVITHVGAVATSTMSFGEVVNAIRGPADTKVTLTVFRPASGETLEFTITRQAILVPSVTSDVTEDGITIFTLSNFSSNVAQDFKLLIAQSLETGSGKFILDLRNNPGGYLDAGIETASQFLDAGQTVVKVSYPDRLDVSMTDKRGPLNGKDVIVLINQGSASASEIVAGALQDHDAAMIMGEKSFGKGTVQELTNYTDGSSLKVTVAHWLTPDDHQIDEYGITPDFFVELSPEHKAANIDTQLNRALSLLRK